MNVTMDKIRQMADSNTIIGKPIKTDDGTTILPVSRISFGFASAGTDFDGKNAANKDLFGGGSGAGVNIQPVALSLIHISEPTRRTPISYAVFCLKKKKKTQRKVNHRLP